MSHGYSDSLGVTAILGETYAMFFRRFATYLAPVLLLAGCGAAVAALFGGVGAGNVLIRVMMGESGPGELALFGLSGIAVGILFLTVMGVVTLITLDLKRGQRVNFASHLRRALAAVPMLIVFGVAMVTLIVGTALLLGLIVDVLPMGDLSAFLTILLVGVGALAIYVRLAPVLAIIVHERPGLGAFSRSFALTSGYFWPILGILIVNIMLIFLISFVIAALAGFVTILASGSVGTVLAFQLINILTSGVSIVFSYLIPAVLQTLIYLRLRTLKEGGVPEDMVAVFE